MCAHLKLECQRVYIQLAEPCEAESVISQNKFYKLQLCIKKHAELIRY